MVADEGSGTRRPDDRAVRRDSLSLLDAKFMFTPARVRIPPLVGTTSDTRMATVTRIVQVRPLRVVIHCALGVDMTNVCQGWGIGARTNHNTMPVLPAQAPLQPDGRALEVGQYAATLGCGSISDRRSTRDSSS